MVDRLTELPEVLLAMVTFRVGLWKPEKAIDSYKELFAAVRVAFKNMQAFRLTCTAVAHMSKARQYFYDLTWKLWSVATSMELVPPPANLLGLQVPGCLHLANLSYFKEYEMYAMVRKVHPNDPEARLKCLKYQKERRPENERQMRATGLLPPAPRYNIPLSE